MQFILVPRDSGIPAAGNNVVYLRIDHWNDYSFVTMFQVSLFDENGSRHELGSVKIGFRGQKEETFRYATLGEGFTALSPEYFSVGTDIEYYLTLSRSVSATFRRSFLDAMRDVVGDQETLRVVVSEQVFQTSHLRALNINTVFDQFRRVLDGGIPLTDYQFRFTRIRGRDSRVINSIST